MPEPLPGWDAETALSNLNVQRMGKLGKQMGLKVKSAERDGERVYSLRS